VFDLGSDLKAARKLETERKLRMRAATMRSLSRATSLLVRRSAPTRRLSRSVAASSLLAGPGASAWHAVNVNQVAIPASAGLQVEQAPTVLRCSSTTTNHGLAEVALLAEGEDEGEPATKKVI